VPDTVPLDQRHMFVGVLLHSIAVRQVRAGAVGPKSALVARHEMGAHGLWGIWSMWQNGELSPAGGPGQSRVAVGGILINNDALPGIAWSSEHPAVIVDGESISYVQLYRWIGRVWASLSRRFLKTASHTPDASAKCGPPTDPGAGVIPYDFVFEGRAYSGKVTWAGLVAFFAVVVAKASMRLTPPKPVPSIHTVLDKLAHSWLAYAPEEAFQAVAARPTAAPSSSSSSA
jgi:hypothetical protein